MSERDEITHRPESYFGWSRRTYKYLILLLPLFFVAQTLVLASIPIRMAFSTLLIQGTAGTLIWIYSVYRVWRYPEVNADV